MIENQSRAPLAEREAGHGSLGTVLAVAGVGIAAATLLSGRAEAQTAAPQHLTLYFTTSPGAGAIQVPDTAKNGTGANIKVLNYALALETLEAETYRQAYIRLTGQAPGTDPNSPNNTSTSDQFGNPIVGLGVSPNDPDALYLKTFGLIERQHRDFLTTALGNNWVLDAGAKIDVGINSLDRTGVDALIYTEELTGVSAYLGAIPSFGDYKYLAVAAAILGTEARHTAAVAIVVNSLAGHAVVETAPITRFKGEDENGGKDTPLTPDQILNQGGSVPAGITIGGTGRINPVSGPKGFIVK